MPITELAQAVDAELTENPLLEEKPEPRNDELTGTEASSEAPERPGGAEELRLGESFGDTDQLDPSLWQGSEYGDTVGSDTRELQRQQDFRQSLLTKPEALSDYLLWQVRFLDLEDADAKIATEIVGNIDEQGYLRSTVEEIVKACAASKEAVEKVLKIVQGLEPPGIAARDLPEALLLQLERMSPPPTIAIDIVRDHLPLLEKRNWSQLTKVLAVNIAEVRKAAELIIHLEPRPGRSFYVEQPIAITPDAAITISGQDQEKIKVHIHNEKIPELRINSYYRRLLKEKGTDAKTREFLKEKLQAALNFMKAISQRRSTLRDITEEIVKAQPDFFDKGFSHLKPLRLKDIADNLGIHESTVSRALQGKYVTTPQGTISYKSLFSTKLQTVSGDTESQKSIMEKIRKVLDKEDPEKPLSDQDLVKLLKGDGIIVARRTVAKYRDLLKILPSHLRRKR